MPPCKYCTWTVFNRAYFLFTLSICCCDLQHMTKSLSHMPPLLRRTLCHTIHMYTVISYFPMLWTVSHTLTHYSKIVMKHDMADEWLLDEKKLLVINFLTLHTSCIMKIFTPTFITVSDPQITTTFFHCTCYKLLQVAIRKCTHSTVDLEAWVMLQYSRSVLLYPHLWGVL